jgi:hypothetical protein
VSIERRIEKLEENANIKPPAGARLYNVDGVQVDAKITVMPTRYEPGAAMLQSGEVVQIAPTPFLEDLARRARVRVGEEKPAESHTRKELRADILFLRIDGCEGVVERMYRGQARRRGGESDADTENRV